MIVEQTPDSHGGMWNGIGKNAGFFVDMRKLFFYEFSPTETGDRIMRPVALQGAQDVRGFAYCAELGSKRFFKDSSVPESAGSRTLAVHKVAIYRNSRRNMRGIYGKFVKQIILVIANGKPGRAGKFGQLQASCGIASSSSARIST